MNKREVISSLLDDQKQVPYTPAAFFIHFDPKFHRGQAAVDKHLEFYNYTGMDFVKIQYEANFPHRPEIQKPQDWAKMPQYGAEFYQDQWNIAEGLVKAAGRDAMVIMTLYSPFICASMTAGDPVLDEHMLENPAMVKKGMEVITESLLTFVRGCIDVGIDGFFHSAGGGESTRLEGSPLFDECIKPYDLAVMQEINRTCEFNILHVCDYFGSYSSMDPFLEYPGNVINCSLELVSRKMTSQEVSGMFGRPHMGGIERLGTIATGSQQDVAALVEDVVQDAPGNFILGADCTLPGDIDWENIRTAIATAHAFER
jgi:uroporphyrinogen decarboxylase